MDGTSPTQLPSDPEQWYQPGDDPVHPIEELKNLWGALGEVASAFVDAFSEAFKGMNGYVRNDHNYHTHFSPARQGGKTAAARAAEAKAAAEEDLALRSIAEGYEDLAQALKPVIGAIHGHWTICEHKPCCKKPPEHASLNPSAGKKKRDRLHRR